MKRTIACTTAAGAVGGPYCISVSYDIYYRKIYYYNISKTKYVRSGFRRKYCNNAI
jgi:hypothetical protein